MTLNDVLTKQNLITKVLLANDGKELPKELKVKIMRIRMSYNKIKKQFDEDTQEFSKQIVSDELRDLANKTELLLKRKLDLMNLILKLIQSIRNILFRKVQKILKMHLKIHLQKMNMGIFLM